jgi:hypothetical protein
MRCDQPRKEALAKVFRAKLLEAITRTGLRLPKTNPEAWVVNCKAVGGGEKDHLSEPLSLSGADSGEGHPGL